MILKLEQKQLEKIDEELFRLNSLLEKYKDEGNGWGMADTKSRISCLQKTLATRTINIIYGE